MSIKLKFIEEVLLDESRRFHSNQARAISKEVKFRTKRIITDRTSSVSSGSDGGTVLSFKFPHYIRLLDIKRERKKKSGKGTTRRSLKIYNRFVYGHYYSIAERLQHDFTEEVRRDIRTRFKLGGGNGN